MEICGKIVEEKVLSDFLGTSFGIYMNANDFFGYAIASGVVIDIDDVPKVLPIFKKYGMDGYNAIMSFIEDTSPLDNYKTEGFNKAMEELKAIECVWVSR